MAKVEVLKTQLEALKVAIPRTLVQRIKDFEPALHDSL